MTINKTKYRDKVELITKKERGKINKYFAILKI